MTKKITVENFDLKSFVVGVVRRSFKKTPMFSAARDKAKVLVNVQTKTGKIVQRVHYKCAHCGELFRDKGVEEIVHEDGTIEKRKFRGEIAVDHIDPVVPVTGWDGYDGFIQRHYLGDVQVLCNYTGVRNGKKSCHSIKTQAENKLRRKFAKEKIT